MFRTIRKNILASLMTLVCCQLPAADFVRGADLSWCTEMEADGMRFYDRNGKETEIFQLMKQIGLNAIRLRVWVNPEQQYGPWSDKTDVLEKCRRAHAAGLDILIDFHYSDCFADPGKQTKPVAWQGHSFEQLKTDIANHTKDVLQAMKDEGIEAKWVQVGNETSSGMAYDDGRIMWNTSFLDASWTNYATLSNAGYDAVKEIFPNAFVIVHHDNGSADNSSFYQTFKQHGGKFDMIGLSCYPDWSDWQNSNTLAAQQVQNLHNTFHVPVMVVETGFSTWDTTKGSGEEQTGDSKLAENVFKDLFGKMEKQSGCKGILYWEPEVYGGWEHYIDENGVTIKNNGAYGKYVSCNGAFTKDGKAALALLVFGNGTTDFDACSNNSADEHVRYYNMQGMQIDASFSGVIIMRKDGKAFKIIRR